MRESRRMQRQQKAEWSIEKKRSLVQIQRPSAWWVDGCLNLLLLLALHIPLDMYLSQVSSRFTSCIALQGCDHLDMLS